MKTKSMKLLATAGVVAATIGLSLGTTAAHAEEVKIGFISTFSGPQAILGNELLDGFKLGLAKSGGKLGGQKTDLILGDDQASPSVGRQVAEKMLIQDKAQIITGVNFTNVLLAVAKPVLDSGAFLVSVNPGPPLLAGKGCNPHFFSVAYQNDQTAEAMGKYLNQKGVNNVYLMAPNYPAGKDIIKGLKRYYKGKVAKEVYTQFDQLDYAAEIADIRSTKPDAVFYFYPGALGVNFLKQYTGAGLKGEIPIYAQSFSLDQPVFAATGDTAIGVYASATYSTKFDNPANQEFVKNFQKAYGRLPSFYAAQSYDTALLLDSAVRAVNGKVSDTKAFAAAMKKADFKSVRGKVSFNHNNFPIQDLWITQVEKEANGQLYLNPVEDVMKQQGDSYAAQCPMKG